MSQPIKVHQPCPDCGSSDARSEWSNGGFFCHSCEKRGKKTMTVAKRVYRKHRGLTKQTLQHYGMSIGIDETGNELEIVFPYPHGHKYRTFPKTFKTSGLVQDLFGRDKFQSAEHSKVAITEGEYDAASVYQMLKCPAVSLSSSSPNWEMMWKNARDWLNSFDQIIVVTDNDRNGDKAASKILQQFPNKTYRVNMDLFKDANDYLQNGKETEFRASFMRAKKHVPDFDVSSGDDFVSILRENVDAKYVPTGIMDYDDRMMGLFQSCFTMFKAKEGIGKTEFMRMLEVAMIEAGEPIAIFHQEETQARSLRGLACYKLGKNVTLKGSPEDEEEVERVVKDLGDNHDVHLFQIQMDEDPDVLIDRIRYYKTVCGVNYVFVEPIQDLGYQRQGEVPLERYLSDLAIKLYKICLELGVGVVTIAHTNDDGEIRDCRMLGKRAMVVIDLDRNVDATDETEKNTTTLKSVKNRPVGYTGYCGTLVFDRDTFTLKERL